MKVQTFVVFCLLFARCMVAQTPPVQAKPGEILTGQGEARFPFLFKQLGVSDLRKAGLPDAQIQQIQQVYENNADRLSQLEAEVKQRQNELRFLLDNTQVDAAQAERAVDALEEARGRLAKATDMTTLEIRQLMTAAQWFKLTDLRENVATSNMAACTPRAPQPARPGVYWAGRNGVSQPELIHKVEPDYTEKARAEKLQGTLSLFAVVGPDGRPRDIQVACSLEPSLDQKAVEALRQWRFRPGMKNGKPVPVAISVFISFRLL